MRTLALIFLTGLTSAAHAQHISLRMDDLIRREMAANDIQSISVALVDHDRIVWSREIDKVQRVGSVSKLFTDIAIMQLVERGQLDLDVPIQRYIPEFRHAVTLRQLMSHRAGLVREPPVGHYFDATPRTLKETVMSLNETELVYKPGERTKYSNAGIATVGFVLEETQKQAFAAYVKQKVLDPLGMAHSSFTPQPAEKAWMWTLDGRKFEAPTFQLGMAPAGSMYTSANDLVAFVKALYHGGAPVLKPETLRQMWSPQFGSGYGLGFRLSTLDGHQRIGHGGAIYGFSTELAVLPDDQLGVVVIANKDGVNAVTTKIADQALRWMVQPPAIPSEWRDLIGEYGWDFNTLFILERDGKLTSLIEWFFFDALQPLAPNVFRYPDTGLYSGEKATFLRDKGAITGVKIGGVLFPRRPDPAAPGATFRLQPVHPVPELLQEALAARPPVETGDFRKPELTELVKLDSSIKLDIRYASTNNFMSTPFYTQARAFMQRPAAEAAVRAHNALKDFGYGLLIHDAYRPWYVTRMFWDGTPPDKHEFVADPSQGSRHNRGCAVDLTLYDLATGQPVEMTGGYDEMSARSYPNYQGGTSKQRWHRDLLRRIMEEQGFKVYESEWWHFDYKDWPRYPILNQRFEALQ